MIKWPMTVVGYDHRDTLPFVKQMHLYPDQGISLERLGRDSVGRSHHLYLLTPDAHWNASYDAGTMMLVEQAKRFNTIRILSPMLFPLSAYGVSSRSVR